MLAGDFDRATKVLSPTSQHYRKRDPPRTSKTISLVATKFWRLLCNHKGELPSDDQSLLRMATCPILLARLWVSCSCWPGEYARDQASRSGFSPTSTTSVWIKHETVARPQLRNSRWPSNLNTRHKKVSTLRAMTNRNGAPTSVLEPWTTFLLFSPVGCRVADPYAATVFR